MILPTPEPPTDGAHPGTGVTAQARRVLERLARIPLWPAVLVFAAAQVADLVTALLVARELNPLAAGILASPPAAIAVKLALIAFVAAVVRIASPVRPLLARVVLLVGVVAGLAGALSNTHLTPFLTA